MISRHQFSDLLIEKWLLLPAAALGFFSEKNTLLLLAEILFVDVTSAHFFNRRLLWTSWSSCTEPTNCSFKSPQIHSFRRKPVTEDAFRPPSSLLSAGERTAATPLPVRPRRNHPLGPPGRYCPGRGAQTPGAAAPQETGGGGPQALGLCSVTCTHRRRRLKPPGGSPVAGQPGWWPARSAAPHGALPPARDGPPTRWWNEGGGAL